MEVWGRLPASRCRSPAAGLITFYRFRSSGLAEPEASTNEGVMLRYFGAVESHVDGELIHCVLCGPRTVVLTSCSYFPAEALGGSGGQRMPLPSGPFPAAQPSGRHPRFKRCSQRSWERSDTAVWEGTWEGVGGMGHEACSVSFRSVTRGFAGSLRTGPWGTRGLRGRAAPRSPSVRDEGGADWINFTFRWRLASDPGGRDLPGGGSGLTDTFL